jgi:cyclophilin family peptidyl-prolyl cis-trans isomerase
VTAARSDALLATAGYTTFGKVIQGMDVVNQIKDVETHNMGMNQDVPVHDITILSAVILKN